MKAMILAAGLGTRLRPKTNYKPKALVEVNEMTLLEIVIRRLKHFGCTTIIINVHHFREKVIQFLEHMNYFDIEIAISDEGDQLLNTGGGIKKAAWFFDDGMPFIVCNTDILSDINLRAMYDYHLASEAMVTLAVRQRESSRYLLFNQEQILHGWINVKSKEMKLSRSEATNLKLWAFSGIHIIDPVIFKEMPDKAIFSIIDVYLALAKHHILAAYPHDEDQWLDVGTHERLAQASALVEKLELA